MPFEGRFPPPLAQCTVVEPCEYRTKLHPLSVNSTTTEAMHYVDHTVHAPAMTLEHLSTQYWFPKLGLLVSEQGLVWRHSFLGPFQEGFLSSVDAIVDRPRPGRNARASLLPRAAEARAEDRGRASSDRQFRAAELRALSPGHRSPDRSRRAHPRADADLDAEALAAEPDRAARRSRRTRSRNPAAAGASSSTPSSATGTAARAARTPIRNTRKLSPGSSPMSARPRRDSNPPPAS